MFTICALLFHQAGVLLIAALVQWSGFLFGTLVTSIPRARLILRRDSDRLILRRDSDRYHYENRREEPSTNPTLPRSSTFLLPFWLFFACTKFLLRIRLVQQHDRYRSSLVTSEASPPASVLWSGRVHVSAYLHLITGPFHWCKWLLKISRPNTFVTPSTPTWDCLHPQCPDECKAEPLRCSNGHMPRQCAQHNRTVFISAVAERRGSSASRSQINPFCQYSRMLQDVLPICLMICLVTSMYCTGFSQRNVVTWHGDCPFNDWAVCVWAARYVAISCPIAP